MTETGLWNVTMSGGMRTKYYDAEIKIARSLKWNYHPLDSVRIMTTLIAVTVTALSGPATSIFSKRLT